jgi:lactoylglutathione lyase
MMHVADLQRAVAFYERVLGFRVVDRHRYEGHALVYMRADHSDMEIELIEPDEPQPAEAAGHRWHLGFTVQDLGAEHRRLSALDVPLDPIEAYRANGQLMTRYFYAYDPDGHQIEFLESRGRYA